MRRYTLGAVVAALVLLVYAPAKADNTCQTASPLYVGSEGVCHKSDVDITIENGDGTRRVYVDMPSGAVTFDAAITLDSTLAVTGAVALTAALTTASTVDGLDLNPTAPADLIGVVREAIGTLDCTGGTGCTSGGTKAFGPTLPDNAIINSCWYEVETTFTTASTDTGTIGLGVPTDGATGIVAANDVADAGNPWDAGLHDSAVTMQAATMIKLTAARRFVATFGVANTTAGKLHLHCLYSIGH